MTKDNNRHDITRRKFLSYMGVGSLAGLAAACGAKINDKSGGTDTAKASGEMTYRVNHNTGDSVSVLGYGCMRLPVIEIPGFKDEDGGIDQEEVNRLVDHALANGINYFDTSPVYCKGRSEEAMGIALSRHPRDSYFLATKLSNFAPETWPREKSIAMFENSLRLLKTDYIDYLLLHSIGGGGMETFNSRYIDNGVLDYLIEQKSLGRIRNLGFSFHGDVKVFDRMLEMMDEGKIHWDFVQIQLNYVDWRHAKEVNERNVDAEYLYGELEKRDIPVVVMEPLLGGRLASMTTPIAAKFKQRRPDSSIASWAFRFAASHKNILCVLSGMTVMEHLKENLATLSPLDPISDDEATFLEIMAKEILANNEIPCNDCKYCIPCPIGIDIPSIFVHYNRCLRHGDVARDIKDPDYLRARRAFLVGYDRSVPRLRQANRCIDCGVCLPKCPQSIDIPAQLAMINDYVEELKRSEGKI